MKDIEGEEIGKTFDPVLNDFTPINYKADLNEFESLRFFDSQINLIASQLSKLAKAVASGMPMMGSNEGLNLLEEDNKKLVMADFKVEYYANQIENIRQRAEKLEDMLSSKAEVNRLKEPLTRLAALEEVYGKFMGPNNKEMYLGLVDSLDKLQGRVNALEISTEKISSSYLGARLDKVRKQIK